MRSALASCFAGPASYPPPFEKGGTGGICSKKSPSIPLFQKGKLPAAALLAIATASGCFSLAAPPPDIREYRLDYPAPAPANASLPVVVRVAPFRVAATYDRKNFVYREGPYALGADNYQRWFGDPGGMVTDLLARDLAASGRFEAVQRSPSSLRSDYELSGEVEEFEERADSSCTAHVRLRALLTQTPRTGAQRVVFQRAYEADEPCTPGDGASFVEAMSRAVQRVSAQLQQDLAASAP